MEDFCDEHQVDWDRCGKVVATQAVKLSDLIVSKREHHNGIAHERIDEQQLHELEPAAAGVAALHVPGTRRTLDW